MAGYQLKITIKDSKPPIWRRVIVPDRITFRQLHQVIQTAFGWWDYHLHEFRIPRLNLSFVDSSTEEAGDFGYGTVFSETERIDEWIVENPKLTYTYDFGDDWIHQIVMEKVTDYSERYPVVVKYKGDNMPEDCGGIWGYYEMLDRLQDTSDPEHGQLASWAEAQGMEAFDLENVNQSMKELVFKPARKRPGKPLKGDSETAIPGMKDLDKMLKQLVERLKEANEAGDGMGEQEQMGPDALSAIFHHYDKKELKRIAKLHRMVGYAVMKKERLAVELARYMLNPLVLKRYFLCMSDQEIETFEKLAQTPGIACEPEDDCGYLQRGGYCATVTDGRVVAPAEVVQVYRQVSTEAFHKRRGHVYKVWTYINAAIYLYGVCQPEQVTALYNLYEPDVLSEVELYSIFKDIAECRSDFIYKNGLYIQELLVEDDHYEYVLEDQKGLKPFVPDPVMIEQIGEMRICEPMRQMEPLCTFFTEVMGTEPMTSTMAAFVIHHQIRIGCGLEDVLELMEEYGIVLETERQSKRFEQVILSVRDNTRMIELYGHTNAELEAEEAAKDPDRPCPCGSGKKYRQCCGRKHKDEKKTK